MQTQQATQTHTTHMLAVLSPAFFNILRTKTKINPHVCTRSRNVHIYIVKLQFNKHYTHDPIIKV